MKYECPRLFLLIITPVLEDQQDRTRVLSCYSMLMHSSEACFEHSDLLKVTSPTPSPRTSEGQERSPTERLGQASAHRKADRPQPDPKSNYELFNCNNINIRYWSWNYRGCWHQTCPPIDPR